MIDVQYGISLGRKLRRKKALTIFTASDYWNPMEASLTSTSTKAGDSDRKESNSDLIATDEKVSPAGKNIDEDILEMPGAMRRVDWRWAVAKGYLNKDTNEWNESMGGQKAYLKQRNDRMVSRSVKLI